MGRRAEEWWGNDSHIKGLTYNIRIHCISGRKKYPTIHLLVLMIYCIEQVSVIKIYDWKTLQQLESEKQRILINHICFCSIIYTAVVLEYYGDLVIHFTI